MNATSQRRRAHFQDGAAGRIFLAVLAGLVAVVAAFAVIGAAL